MDKQEATDLQDSSTAYFCPECGSPSLDLPLLTGGPATCKACKWTGKSQALLGLPFTHEHGTDESIALSLMSDLRVLLSKDLAVPFGRFLLKWGFLDNPIKPAQMGRYLAAIATAVIKTIVEERQKMDMERGSGT